MRWLACSVIGLGMMPVGISVYFPRATGDGQAGERGPLPREVPEDDLGRRLRDLGYTSVPIDRLRAGYLTVRAEVAGHALRLVLDTGSPVSALDRERTAALKLNWDEPPGVARDRSPTFDQETRTQIPALDLGGARAERVIVCRMIASGTNRALAALGDPPVDGLIGGDVLAAVGALIDYTGGRLYVRTGHATVRPQWEIEFGSLDVRLPVDPDSDLAGAGGPDSVRVYASADGGKSWARAGEYRPAAREVQYEAPRDGEYWLALQVVGKDGQAKPAGTEGLVAWRKVRVDTSRKVVRPDPPPADLRQEAANLRREVERLRRRVQELEVAGKR